MVMDPVTSITEMKQFFPFHKKRWGWCGFCSHITYHKVSVNFQRHELPLRKKRTMNTLKPPD